MTQNIKLDKQNIEKFLYQLMEELSKLDAPIIFKGAMVLKIMLDKGNNPEQINRLTGDLDGNWTDKINIKEMKQIITTAVKAIDPNLNVELRREPGLHRSAGFVIYNEMKIPVTKIDLDVKENPFYVEYKLDESIIIRC